MQVKVQRKSFFILSLDISIKFVDGNKDNNPKPLVS